MTLGVLAKEKVTHRHCWASSMRDLCNLHGDPESAFWRKQQQQHMEWGDEDKQPGASAPVLVSNVALAATTLVAGTFACVAVNGVLYQPPASCTKQLE